MNVRLTPQFERSYANAPLHVQKLFDRKLALLVQNLRHPSLRAKKYEEARDIGKPASIGRGVSIFKSGAIPIISLTSHLTPNKHKTS